MSAARGFRVSWLGALYLLALALAITQASVTGQLLAGGLMVMAFVVRLVAAYRVVGPGDGTAPGVVV